MMPLPSPEVILLAKSYAHRLELGDNAVDAANYIRDRFPGASRYQINSAIRQAQRAIEVGQTLAAMGRNEHLREALGGQRAPARTVGVRIQMTRYRQEGGAWPQDRVNDLYIEMPWDATIQDVYDRAREWFDATQNTSGPAVAWEIAFVGPTLWPGASPGLGLEA